LFRAVGLASYVLVLLLMLWGVRHLLWKIPWERKLYWTGILLLVLGSAILFAINPMPFVNVTDVLGLGHKGAPEQAIPGGMIGQFLAGPGADVVPPVSAGVLRKYIGYVGTSIVGYLLLLGGVIIVYLSDWHKVVVSLLQSTAEPKAAVETGKNSAIRDALQAMKERHEANVQQKAEEKREAERLRAEAEAKAALEKKLQEEKEKQLQADVIQETLIPENVETPVENDIDEQTQRRNDLDQIYGNRQCGDFFQIQFFPGQTFHFILLEYGTVRDKRNAKRWFAPHLQEK
jgi:hypothetical protein